MNSSTAAENMASKTARRLVLLVAGASVDAGVPTAMDMTRRMSGTLDNPTTAPYHRALAVIVGGLQMGAGWDNQPISWDVDIERVINAAQLLANRFDAELAPFVGNWHPVLEELERREFARAATASFKFPPDRMPALATTAFINRALAQIHSGFKAFTKLFD